MVPGSPIIVQLVCQSLVAYALTFVITSSGILSHARSWLMAKTPWLKPEGHRHFIECRMCVGFWMAAIICHDCLNLFLPVYGLAYFMATQER